MFNSYHYGIAALLGSGGQAITAIYFVGSALRARRYLSGSDDSERSTRGSVARSNRAAMRRLMRRVLASGCLMLVNTFIYAVAVNLIVHPVGFTALMAFVSPLYMANSLLQLASFVPPAGAPPGPVEEARLALKRAARSVVDSFNGRRKTFTSVSPEPGTPASNRNGGRVPSSKIVFVRSSVRRSLSTKKKPTPGTIWFIALEKSLEERRVLSSGVFLSSSRFRSASSQRPSPRSWNANHSDEASEHTPPNATGCQKGNTQDELAPCDRLGLSFSMLEAFSTHYGITPEMTTTDACDQYIKPYTLQRKCCYVDLLAEEDPNRPDGWVGKTTHFVSHWWVEIHSASIEQRIDPNSTAIEQVGLFLLDPPRDAASAFCAVKSCWTASRFLFHGCVHHQPAHVSTK